MFPALELPGCPSGSVLDGRSCVPARCGRGTWGDIEIESVDLFVDPAAATEGDGSAAAPFATIEAALEAAAGLGTIAVAAGQFDGAVRVDWATDLRLIGRCPDLVHIVAEDDGSGGVAAFKAFSPGGRVGLAGFRVSGGGAGGVFASQGALQLETVEVVDVPRFGILALDEEFPLVMHDVLVRNSPGDDPEDGGGGAIYATPGSRIEGDDITIEQSHGRGLTALGGEIELSDVTIEGVREGGDRESVGIMAMNGGHIVCERCTVRDTDGYGVRATGLREGLGPSTIEIRDGLIADIAGFATDEGIGAGAHAVDRGRVVLTDVTVEGIVGNALVATFEGSTVGAERVVVSGVRAPADLGEGGVAALFADRGGGLDVDGAVVDDVVGWALVSAGEGSEAAVAGLEAAGIGVPSVVDASGEFAEAPLLGGGVAVAAGGTASLIGARLDDTVGASIVVVQGHLVVDDVVVDGVVPTLQTQDGSLSGPGLIAGSGATLGGSALSVARAVGNGIVVAGGVVELEGLAVGDTRPADGRPLGQDLLISDSGALDASAVSLTSEFANGLQVGGSGSTARIRGATLGPSMGVGAVALGGASLVVESSELSGRAAVGAAADGPRSTLELSDVLIEATRDGTQARYAVGAGVWQGAHAVLDSVEVVSTSGVGLLVSEATLEAHDGRVHDSEGVGVYVAGGHLRLDGTELSDTRAIDRIGGYGVFGDHAEVSLVGVWAHGHESAAAWVRGSGSLWSLDGCSLVGGPRWWFAGVVEMHGDALVATGGVPADGLRIADSSLTGAQGAGLFLHGAEAELVGAEFSANALDVRVQGCAGGSVPPPAELPSGVSIVACPEGGDVPHADPDLGFFVNLGGVLSE